MIYSPFSFCLVCCNVCCAAPPAVLLCGSDSSSCFAGTVFPYSWNSWWLSEILPKCVEAEPCFIDRQRPWAKVWHIWERRNSREWTLCLLPHSKGQKLSKEPLHHGLHRDEVPWLNPSPPREAGPAGGFCRLARSPQAMQEKPSGTDINQRELENRHNLPPMHLVTSSLLHLEHFLVSTEQMSGYSSLFKQLSNCAAACVYLYVFIKIKKHVLALQCLLTLREYSSKVSP